MNRTLPLFFNELDKRVDKVRKMVRPFSEALELTGFAYVRVYHDGQVAWLSSDADHDRMLYESGFLEEDPLIDTAEALEKGHYLWFHNRAFPGDTAFYKDRAGLFQIDHGLIVVNHKKEYLETGCFSGLLRKRPLYNTFSREVGVFNAYLKHFSRALPKTLSSIFEQGIHLKDLKSFYGKSRNLSLPRERMVAECGYANLLTLSQRERECLAMLRRGYTYQMVGEKLTLSPRTVESYLQSVKNKLNLYTHAELWRVADMLFQFGLTQ